ncbi:MAG: TonB-dependent receptor [Bacteroidales bacterium]|nr:TonB-dependent receptor [Bacteroidales bacterium]
MKTRIFPILVTFLLTLISQVSRGENINISGKIVDGEDKPIEFATIRMGGTAIGTNSNLQGDYSLTIAERDTVEMIYSCIGFKTVTHTLIKPKGSITLNVRLYTNDVDLKELEVIGYRNNINGMQTFDTEAFKLSPDVSGGSVEAMITTMPGVNSSNEMSSQYSVRGGTFDENSVYINGIEIYRPQLVRSGQQEGLSVINPDMVGNLKFSSGGFPARYTDKMSSALDITYREPEALEAAVSASLMGASISFGQNSGKFSQLHGARLKKTNSLLSSMDTRGEYDPTYFDYQTALGYKINDRLNVSFLGNISLNHYNFKPTDRETTFGTSEDTKNFKVYFDGEEKDKFETYLGALSVVYRHNKATSFSLGLAGFISNELVTYDISGEYWLNQAGTAGSESIGGELGVGKYMEHSRNRLRTSVIQVSLNGTTKWRANNITYGVGYHHENFHDRTKEWEWRDSAGYSLPTLPEGVHLIYNLSSRQDIKVNRFHAFVEDAVSFSNNFAYMTLNGGIRFSYNDFNKEFLFSPRVNFSFNPIEAGNWYYRIGAGMYYQSPFYKEYRQTVTDALGNCSITLNRNIKSPLSVQVIAGADFTFRAMNRPFKLTGEVYYKHLSNLISYEYDNLKITYSGVNDSKGYTLGLDMKLFGQFVEGSDSWISFSLMKTEQTLHGKKVPLPSDQRYSISVYFTDYLPRFPRLKFSLRGVFSDGLTMTAPHTSRTTSYFRAPAYKRLDLGISWQFIGAPDEKKPTSPFWSKFKSLVLGVDAFNLLDITNISSYYWVTDVNNLQYAVPNYLTRRQFNIRLSAEF